MNTQVRVSSHQSKRSAYAARLHQRWRRGAVKLSGGGHYAHVRPEHRPGGARARVRDALRGGHDERGTHDRPAAQVCVCPRVDREPHLIRELLHTHIDAVVVRVI